MEHFNVVQEKGCAFIGCTRPIGPFIDVGGASHVSTGTMRLAWCKECYVMHIEPVMMALSEAFRRI